MASLFLSSPQALLLKAQGEKADPPDGQTSVLQVGAGAADPTRLCPIPSALSDLSTEAPNLAHTRPQMTPRPPQPPG